MSAGDPVPLLVIHFEHRTIGKDAMRVHQDVDGPEFSLQRFDRRLDLGRARYIAGHARRLAAVGMYRGRYVGRRVSARIEDTDRGACARKFNRDRMTKTPGAARDHGNMTLEITRHPFVPPRRTICRQALGSMRTPGSRVW